MANRKQRREAARRNTPRPEKNALAADPRLHWQMFKTMQRIDAPPQAFPYDDRLDVYGNGYFTATVYRDAVLGGIRVTVETADGKDMSWDQLMWVKAQIGWGPKWCVEVYPDTAEVVAIGANLRHLWLLDEAPPCAWTEERERAALEASPELRDRLQGLSAYLSGKAQRTGAPSGLLVHPPRQHP